MTFRFCVVANRSQAFFGACDFGCTHFLFLGGNKMALIPCPECGNMISENAFFCTKCGFPYREFCRKIEFQKQIKKNQNASMVLDGPDSGFIEEILNEYNLTK